MVDTATLELDITESHMERLDELEDAIEEESVRNELAALVCQSIDDTYRDVATQSSE